MSELTEREPAILGAGPDTSPPPSPRESAPPPSPQAPDIEPPSSTAVPPVVKPKAPPKRAESKRDPSTVHVAGFWQRFVGGMIDLGVILPVALIFTSIAVSVSDLSLPPSKLRQLDFWVDQLLATNPVLMTGVVMILAVAAIYLLVFQIFLGRTLGMQIMRLRVIDVWGDRPSIARCLARTAGYMVGVGTILLGFLWVGFDSEKRGLHDWIAGTYVIKA